MPSQLRHFVGFGKTAAFLQYAYPCNLVDLDGNLDTNGSAVPLYLQIFNKATAPSAADVPVVSFMLPAAAPTNLPSLFQTIGPLPLSLGLGFGISTTAGTYTAATATYDLFGDIEEGTQSTDSVSGLTSVVASDQQVQVFAGSSPKKLVALTIVNGEGVVVYPMFFNGTNASDGTLLHGPTLSSIGIGATKTYYFGPDGYTFLLPASNAIVALSSTRPVYTGTVALASTLTAYIKPT